MEILKRKNKKSTLIIVFTVIESELGPMLPRPPLGFKEVVKQAFGPIFIIGI